MSTRAVLVIVIIGVVAGVMLVAVPAHADALRIETLEHGTWPAAVAALQHDRQSEGRAVHVVVKAGSGDQLVPCGAYGLALDAAGAESFAIEGCDPDSASTAVRLVHRRALFDHGDVVARPRAPGITATRVQRGAAAGGAKIGAESAVSCSADVHPFIRDLESGERVELTPGRYELRAHGDGVAVTPGAHGWRVSVHGGSRASADYEVVDTKRGEAVLRDRVTLSCAVEAEPRYADPGPAVVFDAPPAVVAERQAPRDYGAYTPGPPHEERAGWSGRSIYVGLDAGASVLRLEDTQFSNGATSSSGASLGLRDTAAPALGVSASFERPGIYTSLGALIASASEDQRTILHVAVTSTVAAALHLEDATIFLGPTIHGGTTQVSAPQSSSWDYGSRFAFGLGATAGARLHMRTWVLGFDVTAPVAGPAPWLFLASVGFGDAK